MIRPRINGYEILFQVATREHAEGKAPACPFIVICEDEGSDTRPPALITACWDGVSDAWEGSDYSTPRADITGLIEAAKKRAGWGGGER